MNRLRSKWTAASGRPAVNGGADPAFRRSHRVAGAALYTAVRGALLAVAGLVAWGAGAAAPQTPLTPADDAVMLERSRGARDPALASLTELRKPLTANPGDAAAAAAYAHAAIAAGRASSDPRYFGYARAALAPWLMLDDPPLEMRLLRSTLAQREHRFEAALTDLDAVLLTDPANVQALLSRAVIRTVQGRPRDAAENCARLANLGTQLIAVACAASVASLDGRAELAQTTLVRALAVGAAGASDDVLAWVLTMAAEIAARREDHAAARKLFDAALTVVNRSNAPGGYLRAAYADFLIDQKQPAEARALLASETANDALLLRLVLAEGALPDAREAYERHLALLRQRFDLQRARDEALHRRDEARFLLDVEQAPVQALPVAASNWDDQREPADALLLLRAAVAAGDPVPAAPVLAWIKDTGIEDPAIRRLAAQLAPSS